MVELNNKKLKTMKVFLAIIFLITSSNVLCQSYIEKYLTSLEETTFFSGSVLITKGDSVILNKGYGYADYENNIPNTSATLHRIGSLTKPITSMAILKLISDSNRMTLTDSIGMYLLDIPKSWKRVTIFHLLTHTSGIPDHFGDLAAVPVRDTYLEIEKVFKNQANATLENKPGEAYSYNNFGYVILGYLIEVISGKKYSKYLEDVIFKSLKMDRTAYDEPQNIIEGRSQGYRLLNDFRINDKLKDPAAYSAGGLLSSTDDLLKWSKALKTNIILNNKLLDKMFTPFKSDYGLGWQIVYKNGRKMYNHNGSIHGYNTRLVYYPNEDVFIAVLGNNEDVRAAAITCDIEAFLFDDIEHATKISKPFGFKIEELLGFTGDYISESGEKRIIELQGEKLLYSNGSDKYELKPLSSKTLCYANYEDIRIDFINTDVFVISSCSVNPLTFKRKTQ